MTADPSHSDRTTLSDAAEHVRDARRRALQVLGGEAHLGAVDDWRRVLVAARDALILIWVMWVALQGFGNPSASGYFLVVMAPAWALLVGISAGRSTHTQVEYYAAEFDRERAEIRDNFEEECEEVRALYAAKGFQEPLLGQIVDTLSADDDRLLKVMMEEELGLSMHHVAHPLTVGLWNFTGALAAGLMLALPGAWLSPESARNWMMIGGSVLLAIVSIISARSTGRSMLEFFTVGLFMASVTGGVVFLLAQWLSGFLSA